MVFPVTLIRLFLASLSCNWRADRIDIKNHPTKMKNNTFIFDMNRKIEESFHHFPWGSKERKKHSNQHGFQLPGIFPCWVELDSKQVSLSQHSTWNITRKCFPQQSLPSCSEVEYLAVLSFRSFYSSWSREFYFAWRRPEVNSVLVIQQS